MLERQMNSSKKLISLSGGLRWKRVVPIVVVLLFSGGLKWFYSAASVNQLRWILWPTTKLVEIVTAAQFAFEPYAGYMNREQTFLIAASCAGVNFLITAFLMLSLRKMWRDRHQPIKWRFLPLAALIAYATTILANTVRIALALQLPQPHSATRTWLSASELHRLEGILVYFGFLLLLFVIAEEVSDRSANEATSTWRVPRLLVPMGIYYGITLAIPVAMRANQHSADFWEHAAFVLLVPIVLVAPVALFRLLAPKLRASLRPGRRFSNPAIRSQFLD
jgi:exosortase K